MVDNLFFIQLIITEKTSGFFGKGTKTHTVHQGEGMIRCIKWSATYIAWSNSVVSMYHIIIDKPQYRQFSEL